jgi:hypothetical protein
MVSGLLTTTRKALLAAEDLSGASDKQILENIEDFILS